jgi:hypothetical protein
MSQPQIVRRNSGGNVMGDVDVDVVAEEFDPTGICAMDGAKKLSFSFIPVTSWCERNVGGCVVNDSEGTHPEVVHHPRHEPEFDKAPDTSGSQE